MKNILVMKPVHWEEMRLHVAEQAPLEACGLLAGKDDRVEAVLPVHNVAQSPVRFRMDAQEQFDAFMWTEARELDLVGIFHSHPSGPEIASATDIKEAAYDVVHVIWSRKGRRWDARGFWIEAGQATEVTLQVADD